MSELNTIQPTSWLDEAAAEVLLDSSSLQTVLAMLEVIDSLEELGLLETLTPAQKRQVWEATSEPIRCRLKQLRATGQIETALQSSELSAQSADQIDQTEVEEIEELDALRPEAQLQLTRQLIQHTNGHYANSAPLQLGLTPATQRPGFSVGNWIVLQAKPQLSRAELTVIWEVLAIEGSNARIFAQELGHRTYPVAWMMLYPKPADYIEPEF